MTSTEDRIARTEAAEGAGIVSSGKDLVDAVTAENPDAGGIAASAAGMGLDLLGAAMDPLGTLVEAELGWLIEHVAFLREPLDRLCGDPMEIEDRAQAWHALATVLRREGAALDEAVAGDVASWHGAAAQSYRAAAATAARSLSSLAEDAAGIADTVLSSGALVGLERSLIRDLIASWLAKLVVWFMASVISAGIALAAAIPSVVAEAAGMALRFADTVEEIVRVLDEVGAAVAGIARNMESVAGRVRRVGEVGGRVGARLDDAVPGPTGIDLASAPWSLPGAMTGFDGSRLVEPAFEATADTLVEDGKQQADAREARSEWPDPPPPTAQ